METQYFKQYSPALSRDMECKVWGHAGRPVLFLPCQDGRFYDFENYHMAEVWSPWIDSGEIMVFSIDTVDSETWSDPWGNARWRIERYEQWIRYITDEMVPFMRSIANERNHWTGYPGIFIAGCSLGATHAVNLYFRRPDLFDALLALSGIYTSEYGFGTYMDDLIYQNTPLLFLKNMPSDHEFISMYNQKKAVICVGQGAYELPDSTRELEQVLKEKNISVWVDYWGYDCRHDWDWWYRQVTYFVPWILNLNQ